MPISLTVDRAAAFTGRALAEGAYVLAIVLLTVGALVGGIVYGDRLGESWPLLVGFALVGLAGSLLRFCRRPGPLRTVLASVFGAAGVAMAAAGVAAAAPTTTLSSNVYYFSTLTVSVVFLATAFWRSGRAALAVTIAAVATQGIVVMTLVLAGARPAVDVPAIVAWAVVTFVLLGIDVRRRRGIRATETLERARVDARTAARTRGALLLRAAELHDTVLGDLAAIGSSAAGPVPPRMLAHLSRTADTLLRGRSLPPTGNPVAPWEALRMLLAERPTDAIPVVVSGDGALLESLDTRRIDALLLALEQCLTNADRHSSARLIEISVGSSGDDVVVSVADDGVGFDPALVPRSKLGLRVSLQGRVAEVGGRVDVWSREGAGTTVVLVMPGRRDPDGEEDR